MTDSIVSAVNNNLLFRELSPLASQVEELLTHRGASISCMDAERGWSPLMHAAYNGHVEAVAVLLSHRAAVDHRGGRRGSTALQSASCSGKLNVVQQLILAGADVLHPNYDGALHSLCAHLTMNALHAGKIAYDFAVEMSFESVAQCLYATEAPPCWHYPAT